MSEAAMPENSLISLRGASVRLGEKTVLENLDFDLKRGAHCAISGENGSGKSTLLRLLAGQIWPREARTRLYGFRQTPTFTPLLAREKVALLSPEIQEHVVRRLQDGPDNERGWRLDAQTVILSGFFDSWLLHQSPSAAQIERAQGLLREFSLENLADSPLQNLSQGQLRAVLLCRALVKKPEVLLLDEAASGLDSASRALWLGALERVAAGGTTLVLASHRASEIGDWVRERFLVRDKTLHAAPTPVFSAPRETPKAFSPAISVDSTSLIEIKNAEVWLENTRVLERFSWRWNHGQNWRVLGRNGSGKSTFLRLIRGQLHPALGGKIVRFGDKNLRNFEEIGRKIALVSPQIQARFAERMSVFDAVASGFADAFLSPKSLDESQSERVEFWIERLEIAPFRNGVFGELSYGQTRRVLLARALVNAPKILLLDEALDGLDGATREFLFGVLSEIHQNGTNMAMCSHHEEDFLPFLNAQIEWVNGAKSE